MCFVRISEQTATFALHNIKRLVFKSTCRVFTARYAISPYIKQIRFFFKELTLKFGFCYQTLFKRSTDKNNENMYIIWMCYTLRNVTESSNDNHVISQV
jgi:hypothetical protein